MKIVLHENMSQLTDRQKANQRKSLSFDDKLVLARRTIRDWYDHWDGDVFVGFSGGLDSTVLRDIAIKIFPKITCVFSDTGLEMPEIRQFVNSHDGVIRVRPEKTFKQVIEEDGFALVSKKVSRQVRTLRGGREGQEATYDLFDKGVTSIGLNAPRWKLSNKWRFLVDADIKTSEKCCDYLKKDPIGNYAKSTGKKPITGMRAEEGGYRENLTKCNLFTGNKPSSSPLLFWTDDDIWEYVERFNLDVCVVYYHRLVDSEGNTIASSKDRVKWKSIVDNLTDHKVVIEGSINSAVYNGELVYIIPPEKRTGCMFCMFGVHLEKGSNRFQRMYYTHPRHWDTCINKLGLKKPLDLINVKYKPD